MSASERIRSGVKGIIAAMVVAASLFCIMAMQGCSSDDEANLPLTIQAEGYDSGCSRFPVQVTGTGDDGSILQGLLFVGLDGSDMTLAPGEYEVSFPASPLTSDGVLYEVPTDVFQVVVTEEDGSFSSSIEEIIVTYVKGTALAQTEESIYQSTDLAMQDVASGGSPLTEGKVTELQNLALEARSAAVAADEEQKAAEAAQRQAEEAAREAERLSQPYVYTGTVTQLSPQEAYSLVGITSRGMEQIGYQGIIVLMLEPGTQVTGYSRDGASHGTSTSSAIYIGLTEKTSNKYGSNDYAPEWLSRVGQKISIYAPPNAIWFHSDATIFYTQPMIEDSGYEIIKVY